jgi:AraC-like DNA-binding protein
MQSHIKLHLDTVQSAVQTFDALPLSSSMPLRTACTEKFTMKEGILLVQSVSHYLAQIELFEYSFTQETDISFSVNEPAFFMHADLEKDSCYLCYRPAGKYRKKVPAGINKILLITFRSDWLIYKCQKLAELKSFTTSFCNPEGKPMSLSSFGIVRNLFNSLKKMEASTNDLHMDDGGYIFINNCINKYYNKLRGRNATSHYHHHKALAISAFIAENFRSEDADNLPKLASRFMVSERSMARLAKTAFGIPLHEQVIKLRTDYALDQLLTTAKPICEIARLSGYKEPHYFSKAFKKRFSVPPKSIERPYKKAYFSEMQV